MGWERLNRKFSLRRPGFARVCKVSSDPRHSFGGESKLLVSLMKYRRQRDTGRFLDVNNPDLMRRLA